MKRAFPGALVFSLLSVGLAIAQPPSKTEPAATPAPTPNMVLQPYGPAEYGYRTEPAGDYPGPPSCPTCGGETLPRDYWPEDYAWVEAEYILWWIKRGPVAAPLVTVGSAPPGTIGQTGTTVAFGNGIDFDAFSGGRVSGGVWASCDKILGFDATFFGLETRPSTSAFQSDQVGRPVIAQPFFNEVTGTEDARTITTPGLFVGSAVVDAKSRLWGADGDVRSRVWHNCSGTWDILAGFRYAELKEDLTIESQFSSTSPSSFFTYDLVPLVGAGNTFSSTDIFQTRNRFYGGQVGTEVSYHWGAVFVSVMSKLAVGDNEETLVIAGTSSASKAGGGTLSAPAGLYALTSNSGIFKDDKTAIIEETRLRLGLQFCHYLSAYVGYSFLYWSDVLRPGNQIDRVLNPTLIPTSPLFGQALGTSRPLVPFQTSGFWAQGLDFGVALTY
jgi:hypothetical protein